MRGSLSGAVGRGHRGDGALQPDRSLASAGAEEGVSQGKGQGERRRGRGGAVVEAVSPATSAAERARGAATAASRGGDEYGVREREEGRGSLWP